MAKMAKMFVLCRRRIAAFSHEVDEDIWNDLRQGLRQQFPNPQRMGCPKADVLKRLARGRMDLSDAEVWLDHFSGCSPCFCDFEELRSRARLRLKSLWLGGAVAIIIAAATIGSWQAGLRHKEAQSTQAAKAEQTDLHFENVTSPRDMEDQPAADLQRLPRGAVSLLIHLPAGSEAGSYEVAIFGSRSAGVPLATFAGKAENESGYAVLRTSVDLSSVPSGTCTLAVRPTGGRWRYFQIVVA